MFFVVKKRHALLASFIRIHVDYSAARCSTGSPFVAPSRDFFDFICRATLTAGARTRPCKRMLTRTDSFIRPVCIIEWLRIAVDAKSPRPRGNHHASATVCIPGGNPVSGALRAAALLEPWHRVDSGPRRGDRRGRLAVCREEPGRRPGHQAAAALYVVGRGGSAPGA